MYRTLILKFDARILVLVGAVLTIVAVVLPLANLPSFLAGDLARGGVSEGRLFTMGLAVLAALSLLAPWHPFGRVSLPAAILAALCDLVALYAFARVIQLASTWQAGLGAQLGSIGSGLYLTFAGVLLMLAGGLSGVMQPAAGSTSGMAVTGRRWVGYAGWLALVAALLMSCVCAWGAGLLVMPYTLAAADQARATPTFAPAPSAYLATPLVGIAVVPLDSTAAPLRSTSAPVASSPDVTPSGALPLSPTMASALPSPTATRTTPTSGPATLPVMGARTATSTATSTVTRTRTSTPTPPTSPLTTPTRTVTPTLTPEPDSTP
jgi:hypothetical protein